MKARNVFCVVVLSILLAAGTTEATSLNFIGPSYTFSDVDGDGFSEHLTLGSAIIALVEPESDPLFGDPEYEMILFSPLMLDPTAYTSEESYEFAPTTYTDGVMVYDNDGSLLFDADLTVSALIVEGSTGVVNPSFSMNVTNISAAPEYIAGTSAIVDAFLAFPGGATNLTLQFPHAGFGALLESGETLQGTYSGSMAPVPEPSTVFLIGLGLIGAYALRRKRKRLRR